MPDSTTDPRSARGALRSFRESVPGRVALSWCLTGGITAGGLLIAAVTFSGSLSSSVAPTAATILFLLGASAGFVHGAVLGWLGRDLARTRADALRGLAVAAALAVPAAPVAWLIAILLAMSSAALATGQTSLQAGSAVGWLLAAAICAWGAAEGWWALRTSFRRWPERRVGTLIMMGILAILGLTFFLERPEIWFTDIRVSGVGAIALALGATVWIAFPVVLGLLHVIHRLGGGTGPASTGRPLER